MSGLQEQELRSILSSNRIFSSTDKMRLRLLLDEPLPGVQLKPGPTKTNHTSGHLPIERETTSQQLNILARVIEEIKRLVPPNNSYQSSYLKKLLAGESPVRYYTSEADLQSLIGDLLDDIIALSMLKNISVHQETFVPHARYLGKGGAGNKSDFWLIFLDNLQPLLVVEVKSPHVPNVLDDLKVVGQICDYMIDIASFYGQRDVFGVTTNGNFIGFHRVMIVQKHLSSLLPVVLFFLRNDHLFLGKCSVLTRFLTMIRTWWNCY